MKDAARAEGAIRSPRQLAASLLADPSPPADPMWRLDAVGFDPTLEDEIEARFSIANGFLGVRAALEDRAIVLGPSTFVAGLFDTTPNDPPIQMLAAVPDCLRFRLTIDGKVAPLEAGGLGHRRTLDLRHGLLWRHGRYSDPGGRTVSLRSLRFVSLVDRALAVQAVEIDADQPVTLSLEAWIDPPERDLEVEQGGRRLAMWRTVSTQRHLAVATADSLRIDGGARRASVDGQVARWSWKALPGHPATFVRFIAMARAYPDPDPRETAASSLRRARRAGLRRVLDAHVRAWAERWAVSDVEIEGDEAAQRAIRFAAYHLISAANPDDERVSIGARALTGEAYGGHVFWDAEVFLAPFYIFTWPEAARALLMYRYHTLPAARDKARRLGYRGAFYAWESAADGTEMTPPYIVGQNHKRIRIDNGIDELHINAAVAYAVWQYWQATGDEAFFLEAGAEILLETARFWASRAELGDDAHYHLRGVVGPDEYHPGVDDNAYTNVMAQWNLERALDAIRHLQAESAPRWKELRAQLGIAPQEIDQWRACAARLATGLDPASGLIEQFAGFFKLDPVDLAAYAGRTTPMDVLLGPARTRRSQVIKQADVLMLFALLGERFPRSVQAANFRYYEPKCGHGSSLSPATHALVAARLGESELAARHFFQAAAIDLDDAMGNAALGVHIGALGGLWQAAVLGFAGLRLHEDGVGFDPLLPATWRRLGFRLQWRGRRIRIDVDGEHQVCAATLEAGDALIVRVGEASHSIGRGETWSCSIALPTLEAAQQEADVIVWDGRQQRLPVPPTGSPHRLAGRPSATTRTGLPSG